MDETLKNGLLERMHILRNSVLKFKIAISALDSSYNQELQTGIYAPTISLSDIPTMTTLFNPLDLELRKIFDTFDSDVEFCSRSIPMIKALIADILLYKKELREIDSKINPLVEQQYIGEGAESFDVPLSGFDQYDTLRSHINSKRIENSEI